jgi:hypothetical protein
MHEPFATGAGRKEYRFDNGLGASVTDASLFPDQFNLQVRGPDGDVTYDTEGPKGTYHLRTETEVEELLDQIAALNPIVSWRLLGCGHGMVALSSIPTNQLKCPALCDLA